MRGGVNSLFESGRIYGRIHPPDIFNKERIANADVKRPIWRLFYFRKFDKYFSISSLSFSRSF
jgi:hypothetical protein